MTQFLLIVFLVQGSSNLVWELSGQYGRNECMAVMAQRVNAARLERPGATFVGQCYEMAR